MSFRALLDANVLVPITVADVFLRCAEQGFYDLLWSDRIIEEVSRTLVQLNPSIPRNNIDERIQDMIRAFPQATVSDWKVFRERCPELPDSNDEHVCAAAIAGNADVIVTFNLKDFPQDALEQAELFAQGPDEFMLDLWDLKPWYPQRIVTIIDEMSDVRGLNWRDMVHRLSKAGLSKFANLIAEWHYGNNAD